jgi:hypothetical protein
MHVSFLPLTLMAGNNTGSVRGTFLKDPNRYSRLYEEFPATKNFIMDHKLEICKMTIRATLSSAQGMETNRVIRSTLMGCTNTEWEYYTPSRGIQREERIRIPTRGGAYKVSQ